MENTLPSIPDNAYEKIMNYLLKKKNLLPYNFLDYNYKNFQNTLLYHKYHQKLILIIQLILILNFIVYVYVYIHNKYI